MATAPVHPLTRVVALIDMDCFYCACERALDPSLVGVPMAVIQYNPFQGDGWGPGLIYAWQPWSGSFNVTPVVWAAAHTTQFVHPGWRMPWAASGTLAKGGSYVSYVSPAGDDFAVVLETAAASCAHCDYGADTALWPFSAATTQPLWCGQGA